MMMGAVYIMEVQQRSWLAIKYNQSIQNIPSSQIINIIIGTWIREYGRVNNSSKVVGLPSWCQSASSSIKPHEVWRRRGSNRLTEDNYWYYNHFQCSSDDDDLRRKIRSNIVTYSWIEPSQTVCTVNRPWWYVIESKLCGDEVWGEIFEPPNKMFRTPYVRYRPASEARPRFPFLLAIDLRLGLDGAGASHLSSGKWWRWQGGRKILLFTTERYTTVVRHLLHDL